ncbi:MAG: hypothetical protein JO202_18995 [Ktedonobacteraceae bacterium]|nr:hypothetical protein [Ktedonobacteraceae bacterium]
MTDSVPKDPATTPGSQTADTTTQFNKKSGKGLRHGVISELATFFEVLPGHEDELRTACARLAETLKKGSLEMHMKTGLRDERHVIFDGGKRMMWCTTFETDWDPYVEDAVVIIGIENFVDWLQHTKEWPRFEAWLREAGGVEALNRELSDPSNEKSVRANARGLKEFLMSVQTPAVGYFNAVSDLTHPEIRKAMQVEQAFEKVLDTPGADEVLQQPALKPLLELAAD